MRASITALWLMTLLMVGQTRLQAEDVHQDRESQFVESLFEEWGAPMDRDVASRWMGGIVNFILTSPSESKIQEGLEAYSLVFWYYGSLSAFTVNDLATMRHRVRLWDRVLELHISDEDRRRFWEIFTPIAVNHWYRAQVELAHSPIVPQEPIVPDELQAWLNSNHQKFIMTMDWDRQLDRIDDAEIRVVAEGYVADRSHYMRQKRRLETWPEYEAVVVEAQQLFRLCWTNLTHQSPYSVLVLCARGLSDVDGWNQETAERVRDWIQNGLGEQVGQSLIAIGEAGSLRYRQDAAGMPSRSKKTQDTD